MKKRNIFFGLAAVVLVLFVGLAGCVLPSEPVSAPPKDALSYDQLLASLDELQGPAARGLALPGQTMFTWPGGTQVSTRDLSTYLNAIKTNLGSYVYARAGGSPYLVMPVRLSWSASTNGLPNSGLMWVPFTWGRRLSFPIISYQHGTQVYRECAPSRFNANPLAVFSSKDPTGALQAYVEDIVGALMASAGYIVVMPDYPGFGDSTEIHPYVHRSLGVSVKDIIATARQALAGRAVTPNAKLFLTGYSEGGYATMAGARALQGDPTIAAIVPCDGAYDLTGVMLKQMLEDPNVKVPSYLLYTVSGYQSVYPRIPDITNLLEDTFKPDLAYFHGDNTNADIAALKLPGAPSQMLTGTARGELGSGTGPVYPLLAANNGWVGWVPTAPVFLVHCRADDVVPFQNAVNAWKVWNDMGLGALIQIVEVPAVPLIDTVLGSVHAAAYPTAMLAAFTAIDWVNRKY